MKKIICLCIGSIPLLASANPAVTSREYKLMLQSANFSFSSEASDVASFLADTKSVIEAAISRNVTGTEYLANNREVIFYDTSGSCTLKNIGYAFRERIENGTSEVTLKFRDADRYISDFEDLSTVSAQATTKLESDVGISPASNFKVQYSHSSSTPNTRTINEMKDINVQFPGFSSNYGFNDTIPLDVVSNLNITEHVYKGRFIDLGQFDAEISVTLWYNGMPTGTVNPVVAEVSFKYEDSAADYTKKVVNRAKTAFEALQTLTAWSDPNSKTKTSFVYDYDPLFCN